MAATEKPDQQQQDLTKQIARVDWILKEARERCRIRLDSLAYDIVCDLEDVSTDFGYDRATLEATAAHVVEDAFTEIVQERARRSALGKKAAAKKIEDA